MHRMKCFDLHCHSTASDGSLTPNQLIARAEQQGVTHLALTDHDGTEGVIAAQQAAGSAITIIAGVEIFKLASQLVCVSPPPSCLPIVS